MPTAADQGDVFVAHAGDRQFLQRGRQEEVVRAGAGDVGEDDGDLVAGFRHLAGRGESIGWATASRMAATGSATGGIGLETTTSARIVAGSSKFNVPLP